MRTIIQRFPLALIVFALWMVLVGCSPGGLLSGGMMYTPHRQLETGPETLRDALNALSEGDRAGEIVLSEAEFTSLMNAFFVDEYDESSAIKELKVWFEPDTVIVKMLMKEGVLPGIPSDVALNLEGTLTTEDSRLRFNLERGGVGVLASLSPIVREVLEAELDRQVGILFDRTTPLTVRVDTGTLTITLPEN